MGIIPGAQSVLSDWKLSIMIPGATSTSFFAMTPSQCSVYHSEDPKGI